VGRAFARLAVIAALIVLAVPLPAPASDADLFYRDVKAGNYTQAVAYGNAYLKAHPGNDGFALDLAYAYMKLGDRDAARRILLPRDAYFRAHPQAASIWLELSYQDSAARQYRQAVDDVDRALRYRPGDDAARQQRDAAVAALAPKPPDESVLFYGALNAGHADEAIPHGERYLAAHPANDAFAIDLGFAYLQVKNLAAAAAIADAHAAYIDSDKNGAKLLAALFYAYNAAGEPERALAYGRHYLRLVPSDDPFAMDLAYAEMKAGDLAGARAIVAAREPYLRAHPEAAKLWLDLSYRESDLKQYSQAISDVDRYLALQPGDASAQAQRTACLYGLRGGPRSTLFGYTYYDSRFLDTFIGADGIYALGPARGIQPYVTAHLSEDTRSGAPGSPQIYSDDALILDAGARATLAPHLVAFAEAGAGIGLRGQGTIGDVRYGALYGDQWGMRPHGVTSVDASVAVYSRYAGNTIGYYNVRHVFGGSVLRPILGINGGLDSHNVFGNNYIEGIYGIETGSSAVTYRIVGVEGTYLTRGTYDAHPGYSSLRVILIFGVSK
jgi:tetratricopeptide (TPR) repeat protein